eukprot:c17765_g1_i1.p1 GENE.c17765_g1_i1~~c17765_g1_i1.p1  ORF type:complete len:716 (+),score=346.37 c17765_g1_i1:323-2149(+)
MFQRNSVKEAENIKDTMKSLALSVTAPTIKTKFIRGDQVIVSEGPEKNMIGTVDSISDDFVMVTPNFKDLPGIGLNGTIPIKPLHLRKYFKPGDHCRVISGIHSGETGFVVSTEAENVTITTDALKTEITVFAQQCEIANNIIAGSDRIGDYEMWDLVQLDQARVGVIVKFESKAVRVIDNDGHVESIKPQSIQHKRHSNNVFSKDTNQQTISKDDLVEAVDGPSKGRKGKIIHIFRTFAFVRDFDQATNNSSGVFVVRTYHCALPRGPTNVNVFSVPQSPRSNGNFPEQSSYNQERFKNQRADKLGGFHTMGRVFGKDDLLGKKFKIRSGVYKGYGGVVKQVNPTVVRIQLDSPNKTVQVARTEIIAWDEVSQQSSRSVNNINRNAGLLPPETPFRESDMNYYPQTPSRNERTNVSSNSNDDVDDEWGYHATSKAPTTPFRGLWESAPSPFAPTTPSVHDDTGRSSFPTPNTPRPRTPALTPAPATPGPATPGLFSQEDEFSQFPLWCQSGITAKVLSHGGQRGKILKTVGKNEVHVQIGGQDVIVSIDDLEKIVPNTNDIVRILSGENQSRQGKIMSLDNHNQEAIVIHDEDYMVVTLNQLAFVSS